MAATVWKGYITFGLISIPIRLHVAARGERVSFNQLHRVCGSRIKQQLKCPTCDRTVERNEIVKGYEYEKDRYVTVEEAELEKFEPPSAQSMEIMEFVKMQEISPLYFETSYFAVPEPPGRKAYQLLLETMRKSEYAAIAKLYMHQREYPVVVHPQGKGLTLHTMYYHDEVREAPGYGEQSDIEVKPQEVKLAQQLVESLAAPFEPQKYQDEYRRRVRELLEAKRQGQEIVAPEAPRLAPVIDLMEALQKSLAGKKPPVRAAEAQATEARATEESVEEETPQRRKAARRG